MHAELNQRIAHRRRPLPREIDVVSCLAGLVRIAGDGDGRSDGHDFSRLLPHDGFRRVIERGRAAGEIDGDIGYARCSDRLCARRPCRGRLGRRNVSRNLELRSLSEPPALDDDAIARVQTVVDEPVISLPVADRDRALLGLVLFVGDPDEVPFAALLHGPLRDDDGVRPRCAIQPDTDILIRSQDAGRILDGRPNQERSGLRVIGRVGERYASGERKEVPGDELDFHGVLPATGQLQQSSLDLVPDASHLVLGNAEVDPHRAQDRNRRELTVLRAQVGSIGNGGKARNTRNRRDDRRVREVELRFLQLRLALLDRSCCRIVLALRVVQVLLR